MAWSGIGVGEKVFAYLLFTVFEVILISGMVGYCLGWSDASSPTQVDPNSVSYTQLVKNCVRPPPPVPKSEDELEHEERLKALVPGERRAAVEANGVSCFGSGGGSSSAATARRSMELYTKPSLLEPPSALATHEQQPPPPPLHRPKAPKEAAKGPGSDISDKSSGSAGSGKNTNAIRRKSGTNKSASAAPAAGGAAGLPAAKRPPPPKKATAVARKEEVELV